MRRRDFIQLLGGMAAAWPLAAGAQQPTITIPVIGFMHARSADDTVGQVSAFRCGLAEAGLVEGQSVKIEYHFADGQYDQLPLMAADFVRQAVIPSLTRGETRSSAYRLTRRCQRCISFVNTPPPVV
jgi:putative ABC transport system substrate-binding protein